MRLPSFQGGDFPYSVRRTRGPLGRRPGVWLRLLARTPHSRGAAPTPQAVRPSHEPHGGVCVLFPCGGQGAPCSCSSTPTSYTALVPVVNSPSFVPVQGRLFSPRPFAFQGRSELAFQHSQSNPPGFRLECMGSVMDLGKIGTFTTLSFPIREHGMSFR